MRFVFLLILIFLNINCFAESPKKLIPRSLASTETVVMQIGSYQTINNTVVICNNNPPEIERRGTPFESEVDMSCISQLAASSPGDTAPPSKISSWLTSCRPTVDAKKCKLQASKPNIACYKKAFSFTGDHVAPSDILMLQEACKDQLYTCY